MLSPPSPAAVRRKRDGVCEYVLRAASLTLSALLAAPLTSKLSEQCEHGEQPWRRGERKALGGAFPGKREAGERLTQPASLEERNLLTRSPCSRKELFWDPPARAGAVSWTISGVAQEAPPTALSWIPALSLGLDRPGGPSGRCAGTSA